MRSLPNLKGLEAALVVRTDYSDERTWRDIEAELRLPWGEDEEFEARVHIVDDPVWAGAPPEELLAGLPATGGWVPVVFVADLTTMRHSHYALLAVDGDGDGITAAPLADTGGPAGAPSPDGRDGLPAGASFRLEPGAVQDVYGQLFIANIGFEDFVESAWRDSEHVLRSPY